MSAHRSDHHQLLAPGHGDLADRDCPRVTQRLADDAVALGRLLVGGEHVIGPLEKARIDLRLVDALDEIDGAPALETDGLDLLGLEQHIDLRLDLIALDDVGILDLADPGHGSLIAHALAGRFVNLIEADLGSGLDRRIDLDSNRHQRQAQSAFQ